MHSASGYNRVYIPRAVKPLAQTVCCVTACSSHLKYTNFETTHGRAVLRSGVFRQAQGACEGLIAVGAYIPDAEMNRPNVSWNVHPPQTTGTPYPRTLNHLPPPVLVPMHKQVPSYGRERTSEGLIARHTINKSAVVDNGCRSDWHYVNRSAIVLKGGRVYVI